MKEGKMIKAWENTSETRIGNRTLSLRIVLQIINMRNFCKKMNIGKIRESNEKSLRKTIVLPSFYLYANKYVSLLNTLPLFCFPLFLNRNAMQLIFLTKLFLS